MLIIDDVFLFPFNSITWIFREINNTVQHELLNEAEAITVKLSELYMMLETGKITEAEFDTQEKELLDRLEEIEEPGTHIMAGHQEEDWGP